MSKVKHFWPQIILLGATLLLLKDLLFFGKIFTTPAFGLSDYTLGTIPQADYLTKSLKTARFPLWVPEISSGYPFAASAESGLFNPLILLLSFFFSTAASLNLQALLTFLLLGFSTFSFVKSLSLSKEAALLASLSFTFSAGLIARIIHLPILSIIAYFPLSLLLVEKYFARKNILYLVGASFILSLEILSYHPQTTMMGFFLFGSYFLYKFKLAARSLSSLFLVFLASFLLSAAMILPQLELFSLSSRSKGVNENLAKSFPFHFSELAYFLRPAPIGNPSLGNYNSPHDDPGIFWENNAYVGLLALFLGIFSLVFLSRRQKMVLFFSLVSLLGLFLALAGDAPWFSLLRLPPFSFFRIPGRYLVLTMFSLCILAAYGFETITQKFPGKRPYLGFLGSLFVLVDLFSFNLFYNPTYEAKKWLSPTQTVEFLKKDASFFRIYTFGEYDAYYPVYRQFRGWQHNFEPYYNLRENLPANFNLIYGLSHSEGNTALPPLRFEEWRKFLLDSLRINDKEEVIIPSFATKMLRIKNVKYLLSPFTFPDPQYLLKKEVNFPTNQPGFFLYELKDPLPHALLVNKARILPTAEQVLKEFAKDDFDPQKEILLEEFSAGDVKDVKDTPLHGPPGEAKIVQYLPEKVTIKVETNTPSFLLLTDTYYPGWQAKIDNQLTKIYQADYLFRAVRIEPGKHQIEFIYQPRSLYLGVAISLTTFMGLTLFSFFFWRLKLHH